MGDRIEGTEAQQRRFDEITGQHKAIKIEKVKPLSPWPPYDSEGSYIEPEEVGT